MPLSVSATVGGSTALPSASTCVQAWVTFVPHGPPPVPAPPSATAARAPTVRSAAASADGRKPALPGLLFNWRSLNAVSFSKNPGRQAVGREVVVIQKENLQRAQPVEQARRQRGQRVVVQKEARHPAQARKVPRLQRRDALVSERQ